MSLLHHVSDVEIAQTPVNSDVDISYDDLEPLNFCTRLSEHHELEDTGLVVKNNYVPQIQSQLNSNEDLCEIKNIFSPLLSEVHYSVFHSPKKPFAEHTKFGPETFIVLASPSVTSRSSTNTDSTNNAFETDPFAISFNSVLNEQECDLALDRPVRSGNNCRATSRQELDSSNMHLSSKETTLDVCYNSDYLTLGRAYSCRFPVNHHLNSQFVRSYVLNAELGCGGYGFVMAAHDLLKDQEVGVKFIFKEKIPDHAWAADDLGKRVPLEAKILSFVQHDGIVKFYDLFEDDLYFYLVQELHGSPWCAGLENSAINKSHYPVFSRAPVQNSQLITFSSCPSDELCCGACHSKTLKSQGNGLEFHDESRVWVSSNSLIRPEIARRPSQDLFECIEQSHERRLSEEDAKHIFAQVVDIVDYLDSLGIVHRDIKDENLLIDQDRKVKLIDFGSVVVEDPKKPRPYYDLFYGTAAYAASEILRKKSYQAAPAEVWTLGVLLSYLLTGSSPFPTEQHTIEGCIALETSSVSLISKSCLHLLTRCLEADPEKRADIEEIKNHPWLQSLHVNCNE